jgi:hypothetical protein
VIRTAEHREFRALIRKTLMSCPDLIFGGAIATPEEMRRVLEH